MEGIEVSVENGLGVTGRSRETCGGPPRPNHVCGRSGECPRPQLKERQEHNIHKTNIFNNNDVRPPGPVYVIERAAAATSARLTVLAGRPSARTSVSHGPRAGAERMAAACRPFPRSRGGHGGQRKKDDNVNNNQPVWAQMSADKRRWRKGGHCLWRATFCKQGGSDKPGSIF